MIAGYRQWRPAPPAAVSADTAGLSTDAKAVWQRWQFLPEVRLCHQACCESTAILNIAQRAASDAGVCCKCTFSISLQGERLAEWVREHGGYVHEALALSNATDCGSRCMFNRPPQRPSPLQ
jgi:hypothetical protein